MWPGEHEVRVVVSRETAAPGEFHRRINNGEMVERLKPFDLAAFYLSVAGEFGGKLTCGRGGVGEASGVHQEVVMSKMLADLQNCCEQDSEIAEECGRPHVLCVEINLKRHDMPPVKGFDLGPIDLA